MYLISIGKEIRGVCVIFKTLSTLCAFYFRDKLNFCRYNHGIYTN